MTSQGPSSPSAAPADDLQPQAFPTTEIAESGPKVTTKWVSYTNFIDSLDRHALHRPSLARLATVDEHSQTNTTSPPELDTLSPTSAGARARIESTTSSRMFPGGWFSGNPKTPEDNRASIEHASGEFARSDFTASPALEAPVNTPVDDADHHDKKKHKYCVIM